MTLFCCSGKRSPVYLTITCSISPAAIHKCSINSFQPNVPLLYPLKTSENFCFQWVEKWNIGLKWVKSSSEKFRNIYIKTPTTESFLIKFQTCFPVCLFLQPVCLQKLHPLLPLENIYMIKMQKRNIRERCEVCSKLTVKTSQRYQ